MRTIEGSTTTCVADSVTPRWQGPTLPAAPNFLTLNEPFPAASTSDDHRMLPYSETAQTLWYMNSPKKVEYIKQIALSSKLTVKLKTLGDPVTLSAPVSLTL